MRAREALLFALALLAFVSLGLPDAVLGVAWPSLRRNFSLPVDRLGILLFTTMAGYLASSFGSGAIVKRTGVGGLLVASSILVVASCAGYALAPSWSFVVAAAVPGGLGAGAIDAAINAYAAARFPPRRVAWLHACWGVGATLGPLLMTAVLGAGRGWQSGYAIIASLLAVLALGFLYWGSLTLGRLVSGVLAHRMAPATLLRTCVLLVPVGALGVASATGAVLDMASLALIGFTGAPVFPLLISGTPQRVGGLHAVNAVGFQVSAACLGAAALPAAAGVLARAYGLETIAVFLVVSALTVVALHEAVLRGERKRRS